MQAEAAAIPRDVVLICVHGIGRQAEGQTASEVAHAVRLGAAELGLTIRAEPARSDETGRLSLGRGDRPPWTIGFVDGRWDHLVGPPATRRSLAWMLRVAPFALWLTAAAWMFETERAASLRYARHDPRRALLPFLGVSFCTIVMPVLMIVFGVTATALWPIRRFRRAFRQVIDVWIGDAWSYRSDLLDGSVITDIAARVRRARSSGAAVMLVGHSQGGEIARRVALDERVEACVRVGSGELILGSLRMLRSNRWTALGLWLHILIAVPLFAAVATATCRVIETTSTAMIRLVPVAVDRVLSDIDPGAVAARPDAERAIDVAIDDVLHATLLMFAPVTVFAAASLLGVIVVRRIMRWPRDMVADSTPAVMIVKSLLDPVCPGPFADGAALRYVPARKPWHREHVSYFEKPETGIALIESIVGTEAVSVDPYVPRAGAVTVLGSALAALACVLTLWAAGNAASALLFP